MYNKFDLIKTKDNKEYFVYQEYPDYVTCYDGDWDDVIDITLYNRPYTTIDIKITDIIEHTPY